jgi:chloramphenicol 3-O-phosphotransferase
VTTDLERAARRVVWAFARFNDDEGYYDELGFAVVNLRRALAGLPLRRRSRKPEQTVPAILAGLPRLVHADGPVDHDADPSIFDPSECVTCGGALAPRLTTGA